LERIVGAVGGVTRLTVAVLVDERALQSNDLAQGGVDNRLASIEAMVRDAIGIDDVRNDRITVTAIPFEPVTVADDPLIGPVGQPSGSMRLLEIAQRLSRPLIALTAIVALLLLAWRVLRTVPALPRAGEATQESLAASGVGNPDLTHGAEPSPAALIQQRLQTVAADRPELTAQVVRTWLTES
jgi:flagellar biosynthesis/type III secretory pathway M-ring protein FliF/YscJ